MAHLRDWLFVIIESSKRFTSITLDPHFAVCAISLSLGAHCPLYLSLEISPTHPGPVQMEPHLGGCPHTVRQEVLKHLYFPSPGTFGNVWKYF